jgi:MoaA/NifB/PqqE/SkfB family radical SAM enzyme
VIRNLERILNNRRGATPSVGLNIVILKENFHTLHDLIELCGRMGVDYLEIIVDPVLSFSGLPDRAAIVRELELCAEAAARWNLNVSGLAEFAGRFALPVFLPKADLPQKPMCMAPFHNLVVDWNGDVRVCCNTWLKIGNLHSNSLEEVFLAEKARRFRHKMERNDYLWCSPSCVDNANPTRLALAHKYAYEAVQDRDLFVRKVKQKLVQLQGRARAVRKRTRKLGDPQRAGYKVAETNSSTRERVRLPIVSGDA